jgi:hypothetical protein
MEAEGFLKHEFGERDIVYCSKCHQFTGECCELRQNDKRRTVRVTVYALFVTGIQYCNKYDEGTVLVAPDRLADFYTCILDGNLALAVSCRCAFMGAAGCSVEGRPCCTKLSRNIVPRNMHVPKTVTAMQVMSGSAVAPPAPPVAEPPSAQLPPMTVKSAVRALGKALYSSLTKPPEKPSSVEIRPRA